MPVLVGSARIDENGNANGGIAGDQRQMQEPDYSGEVSMQEWYLHPQGWVLLRAKDEVARKRIAEDMRWACDNPHIGYNQTYNYTLYQMAKPVGFNCRMVYTDCETDCARLVRVCVLYAGIDCLDFYTGNEASALMATGQFEKFTDPKYTESSNYLLEGDILVTKTKGHTVVVLSDGEKAEHEEEPVEEVEGVIADFQRWLNRYYPSFVKEGTGGDLLEVDNIYGKLTRAASLTVWKYMANKYYDSNLTIGNTNFFESCLDVAQKINYDELKTHPTLAVLLEGQLAGKGFYNWSIDGASVENNRVLRKALYSFNLTYELNPVEELTASTWYWLYN